ncbi:MAG TPA: hypothetical protein VFP33_11965, partial [Gallionella sp.]|nr:hypothetical protein [Gallionella sp.]
MAGFISRIQRSADGKTYRFVIYDEINDAALYLPFASPLEADSAALQMQGMLATAQRCARQF